MDNQALIESVKKHQAEHAKAFERAKSENTAALSQIAEVAGVLTSGRLLSHFEVTSGRKATLTAYFAEADEPRVSVTTSIEDGVRRYHISVVTFECPAHEYVRNTQEDALAAFVSAVEREGGYNEYMITQGPGEDDD